MKTIQLSISVLLFFLLTMTQQSFGQSQSTSWLEDFSNEMTFRKNWIKYDRKVPKTDQRFWQIEKGVIQGLAYKKIHPVGVMRDISGKNLRITCRLKLGKGAGVYFGVNGMNNGSNRVRPDQKHINFRRGGIHILANQEVFLYDERYIHLSAEELKQKDAKTTIGQKTKHKFTFSTDVWHDVKIEIKENDLTFWFNGKKVKTHKMHSANEAKRSFNFSVGHETRDPKLPIVSAWFDDMKFESID